MRDVEFDQRYNDIAKRVLDYRKNFPEMSAAQRAEGAVQNAQDMNKLYADKGESEFLGQHVNILV